MPRYPVEDQQPDRHREQDPKFQSETARAEQFADVRLLDRQMAEWGRLGLVEQEDEEWVERVEGREEEVGRDVEGYEQLKCGKGASGRSAASFRATGHST
jgi:hypothetical protein